MNKIQINQGDILWRLYCLYFTLNGVEQENPKNLCNYFQTAIKGLLLWPVVKLNLFWCWTGLVCGYGLSVLYAYYCQEYYASMTKDTIHVLYVLHGAFTCTLLFASLFVLTISFSRFDRYCGKHPFFAFRFMVAVVGIELLSVVVWGFPHANHYRERVEPTKWFLLLLAPSAVLLLAGILYCLRKLISKITPSTRWRRIVALCCVIGIRFDAWKQGGCPLVEPPKEE